MKDTEFIGGKLKIKGLRIKNKKKKKKEKCNRTNFEELKHNENIDSKEKECFHRNKSTKEECEPNIEPMNETNDEDEKLKEILESNLTEAEKAYQLVLKKREKQRIENILKESYRERLQKFNDNLASLSEHFDIPKVGPG